MRKDELDLAIDWAREEGWNPGIHDAECFYEQDPEGFFIGLLDNKPIAAISAVKYGEDYAFGGLYIVKAEYRGKGYGMKLFEYAVKSVGLRNIGGDGVIENLGLYAKVGLKLAHYNARFQFKASAKKFVSTEGIVGIQEVSIDDLIEYDLAVFGWNRAKFLKLWISRPETQGFVYKEGEEIKGYGVTRKCFEGYKIGPLFADSSDIAKQLFFFLAGSIKKGSKVYWDVNEDCVLVPELVKEFNMKKVFRTGRVYSQGQPAFPLEKWYGITSFELG